MMMYRFLSKIINLGKIEIPWKKKGGKMKKILEEYKNNLYNGLSKIGKCLSSEKRIEILDLLVQGPKTVENISNETGMTIANTSKHLQTLKDGRLVSCEKKGNFVEYKISNTQIIDLVYLLRDVGERQLEDIKKIHMEFEECCNNTKTLSLEKAYEMVKKDEILIIDLRPEDEFNSNHIEKSINIPMKTLEDRINEIPKNKEIILYCRGRNCGSANLASKYLNERGFKAYSLNQSYYDWEKFEKILK